MRQLFAYKFTQNGQWWHLVNTGFILQPLHMVKFTIMLTEVLCINEREAGGLTGFLSGIFKVAIGFIYDTSVLSIFAKK